MTVSDRILAELTGIAPTIPQRVPTPPAPEPHPHRSFQPQSLLSTDMTPSKPIEERRDPLRDPSHQPPHDPLHHPAQDQDHLTPKFPHEEEPVPAETGLPPAEQMQRLRSIGVPKAGLPHLPEVVQTLRDLADELGHTVSEQDWAQLPHRLLANYPFLLREGAGQDGLLIPLGKVEALVTLDLDAPQPVRNPGGSVTRPDEVPGDPDGPEHVATGTVNATYATGAHVQREGGSTSATRGAVSAKWGIGLPNTQAHVLAVGAGVSGTANVSGRSTSHTADSERGHVEDNRDGATLTSWEPTWTVRLRPPGDLNWRERKVATSDDERLLLWVPKSYLEQPPRSRCWPPARRWCATGCPSTTSRPG